MTDIKIAGIMRSGAYSPNRIGTDAAIFNAVTEQLRKRGCQVKVYSEEQLAAGEVTEDVVVNMCRQWHSIEVLQALEDRGVLVINSGYGIENCTHSRMTRILVGCNVPFPESIVVGTDEVVRSQLTSMGFTRCWVKRGDFHSVHKEDVSFVRSAEEAQEVLKEYFLRGIKRAVITKHIDGEQIKFYGVQGTNFFYHFHASQGAHALRGTGTTAVDVDLPRLRRICNRASEELDVKIYGGDCIVAPDGRITIIDFNDWPSFSPCRDAAATAIAKCVIARIKNQREGGARR